MIGGDPRDGHRLHLHIPSARRRLQLTRRRCNGSRPSRNAEDGIGYIEEMADEHLERERKYAVATDFRLPDLPAVFYVRVNYCARRTTTPRTACYRPAG